MSRALGSAVLALLAAVPAAAMHNGPEHCYACHSLSPGNDTPGTAHLNKAARSLQSIRDLNQGTVPEKLGCTYCHWNPLNTVMKNVFDHFGPSVASKHPLSRTFSGIDKQAGRYLSTIGSVTPDELDCVDCHDPALLDTRGTVGDYFTHLPAGSGARESNPSMLRGIGPDGNTDDNCRLCHGRNAASLKGRDLRLRSHHDGSDDEANRIRENDGTPLKTSQGPNQCLRCHAAHSSNLARLANDGQKNPPAIDPLDCVTVCHFAGDSENSFNVSGHGKAVGFFGKEMGLQCVGCHSPSGDHSGTSSSYKVRNRLQAFPESGGEGTSFGSAPADVCRFCHGDRTKRMHTGERRSGGTFTVGCLDCHDEHAEGCGSEGNVAMIPLRARPNGSYSTPSIVREGAEVVYYRGITDRYTSAEGHAGEGICDVVECHGDGVSAGFGPLSAVLTPAHTGGLWPPGSDCRPCHGHAGAVAGKGFSGAPPDCAVCHRGTGGGALDVGPGSPHTHAGTRSEATGASVKACTACHPGGEKGGLHSAKGDAGVVGIPNFGSTGIAYPHEIAPGVNGFFLGGDATGTHTTEAEICWNCHYNTATLQSSAISEWGRNTNPLTGSSPYDYGSLDGYGWSGARWSSGTAAFMYKNGPIQSTHSANPVAGSSAITGPPRSRSELPDPPAVIRCSYCHDVHDLDRAPNDNSRGRPWLRGSWLGNPYPEDGAPQAGTLYASVSAYGAVPRGGTAYTESGGYFIDQNVPGGAPWTASNLGQVAGLCVLCHGSAVDAMDWTPGEQLWMGTAVTANGHANAVIGGSGSAAGPAVTTNIFDYSHGRVAPRTANLGANAFASLVPNQGWVGMSPQGCGYGYRGTDSTAYNGGYNPPTDPPPRAWAWFSYNWGAVVDEGTLQDRFHSFPCSKCHNPHASRLPKLLITNCLDARHNRWDDANSTQSRYTAPERTDQNRETAYFDSAQNCHRATPDEPAGPTGWNRVSPW